MHHHTIATSPRGAVGVDESQWDLQHKRLSELRGAAWRRAEQDPRGSSDSSLVPFEWAELIQGALQIDHRFDSGAWSSKSYDAAEQANAIANLSLRQSLVANQLALVSFCGSSQVKTAPRVIVVILIFVSCCRMTTQDCAISYCRQSTFKASCPISDYHPSHRDRHQHPVLRRRQQRPVFQRRQRPPVFQH
jgi:hypothetical protein